MGMDCSDRLRYRWKEEPGYLGGGGQKAAVASIIGPLGLWSGAGASGVFTELTISCICKFFNMDLVTFGVLSPVTKPLIRNLPSLSTASLLPSPPPLGISPPINRDAHAPSEIRSEDA